MVRLVTILAALAITACVAALGSAAPAASGKLVIYPVPRGQALSYDYTVRVRIHGGVWRKLDAYRVVVDLDTKSDATLVSFDSKGSVEVSVRNRRGPMHSARVRPLSLGIKPRLSKDGRSARFILSRPLKVSFEADGDRLHNLHVFANPIERKPLRAGQPKVVYFGPGLHRIPGDHVLDVASGSTVYLAGGAVVQGVLAVTDARNVVIRGHGILDPAIVFPEGKIQTITIVRSKDVAVRDITIINSPEAGFLIGMSQHVTLANVKEIDSSRWSDGVDFFGASDVLVDDSFLRTSDDSIAIYASGWGYHGGTSGVAIRNSVLWADVAHPVLIGTHGEPAGNDVIEQISLQNIDILEHDEDLSNYQGALAVNAGDAVSVRDVRFDNIRIDDFSLGQLVNVRVFLNVDYNKAPGTVVERVLFRNVSYRGSGDRTSLIEGYDDSRQVRDVTFENLKRQGRLVRNPTAENIRVGPFASNIVFRGARPSVTWNDGNAAIVYSGHWLRRRAKGSYRGDTHLARTAGSKVSFAFSGSQARVLGVTSPARGKVDVYLDGTYRVTVDTYSLTRRTQQIWFDTGVLPSGRHALELRCQGKRDRLASGTAIELDAIRTATA